LINTAHSTLCDPDALLETLSQNPDMYAAFDGFYHEFDKNNPVIEKLQRFIPKQLLVTPHVAWRTFEADIAAYEMAIGSVKDFMNDLEPRNTI
jgi:lactate dehydrogenase-like 2-hydroxyacid dehydrogenase